MLEEFNVELIIIIHPPHVFTICCQCSRNVNSCHKKYRVPGKGTLYLQKIQLFLYKFHFSAGSLCRTASSPSALNKLKSARTCFNSKLDSLSLCNS